MHKVNLPGYTLYLEDGLPPLYSHYCEHASYIDEIDIRNPEGGLLFLGIATDDDDWPALVSAQKYSPDQRSGFFPGVLIVPGTARAFVGAGHRLLCYDLKTKTRLWEDHADSGFLHWGRTEDHVYMLAEIEFAVWTAAGEKCWTTFVDPPTRVEATDDAVTLHMFDNAVMTHRLHDGQPLP